jgi:hypothetical protein
MSRLQRKGELMARARIARKCPLRFRPAPPKITIKENSQIEKYFQPRNSRIQRPRASGIGPALTITNHAYRQASNSVARGAPATQATLAKGQESVEEECRR